MTEVEGFVSANPDLTLTINNSDLELTMAGDKTLAARIADGSVKTDGDPTVLDLPALSVLSQATVDFDPIFEVFPGTRDPHYKMHPKTI